MVRLVDIPVFSAEVARLADDVQTALPDWRNDESSPLRYALEQRVRDKILDYTLLNESGQALIIADATGRDLDRLLENFDMTRRSGESDEDFKGRVPDQWTGLNRDTEPGILNYLRGIAGVSDATLARGANYAVTAYIQGPDYGATTPTLRTRVQAELNRDDFKPWYADFTVGAETRTPYMLAGTVMMDTTVTSNVMATQDAIDDALRALYNSNRRLNRSVVLSPFIAAVQNLDEVASVSLTFAGAGTTPSGPLAAAISTVWVGSHTFGAGAAEINVTT